MAGEGQWPSWGCVAPQGRFVEIGKADNLTDSPLPMAGLARNVLFAAADLASIVRTKARLTAELLTKAMDLVAEGAVRAPPAPASVSRCRGREGVPVHAEREEHRPCRRYRDCGVEVAVLEILGGGTTATGLGALAVEKVEGAGREE